MRRERTVGAAGEETGVIRLYRESAQAKKKAWIKSGEEYDLTAKGRMLCMILGCLETILVLLLFGLEFRAEYLAVYGFLSFAFAVLSKAALISAAQVAACAAAAGQQAIFGYTVGKRQRQRLFGYTAQKCRRQPFRDGRKHLVNPALRCYTVCHDGREWNMGKMRRAG